MKVNNKYGSLQEIEKAMLHRNDVENSSKPSQGYDFVDWYYKKIEEFDPGRRKALDIFYKLQHGEI